MSAVDPIVPFAVWDLVKGSSVEEKVAAVILLQKYAVIVEQDDRNRRSNIEESICKFLRFLSPAFVIRMINTKNDVVHLQGVMFLATCVKYDSIHSVIQEHMGAILESTKGLDNEGKFPLYRIIASISHATKIGNSIEKHLSFLLAGITVNSGNYSSATQHRTLDICAIMSSSFSFGQSSELSSLTGNKASVRLSSAGAVSLQAVVMRSLHGAVEEKIRDCAFVNCYLLLTSLHSSWTMTTTENCGASGDFVIFLFGVVFSEVQLLLEELVCIYDEFESCSALVDEPQANEGPVRVQKERNNVDERRTRCEKMYFVLFMLLDLFLGLLVDEPEDANASTWQDIPTNKILEIHRVTCSIFEKIFQFFQDTKIVFEKMNSNDTCKTSDNGDSTIKLIRVLVQKACVTCCVWAKEDESLQAKIMSRISDILAFSCCRYSSNVERIVYRQHSPTSADLQEYLYSFYDDNTAGVGSQLLNGALFENDDTFVTICSFLFDRISSEEISSKDVKSEEILSIDNLVSNLLSVISASSLVIQMVIAGSEPDSCVLSEVCRISVVCSELMCVLLQWRLEEVRMLGRGEGVLQALMTIFGVSVKDVNQLVTKLTKCTAAIIRHLDRCGNGDDSRALMAVLACFDSLVEYCKMITN